jgi:predicted DNA-binding protein (UPF0251 family)
MSRTKICLCNKIKLRSDVIYFKPQNVPLRELKINELSIEEIEAYRLRNIIGLEQMEAASRMKISQSTYQRILYSAYNKVADALVNGKAIKIIKHIKT